MSLRLRLFIIIGILALGLLAVSLFLVLKNKQLPTTPIDTNPVGTPSNLPPGTTVIDSSNFNTGLAGSSAVATPIPAGLAVKPISQEESIKKAVQQLAKIFIERFGSYSTDSNFSNINEVQALVTPTLWERIKPKTAAPATGQFVGVTTQVITMEITKYEADKSAAITLTAIRSENKSGQETRTQSIANVTMVKSGNNWLVDSFAWSK